MKMKNFNDAKIHNLFEFANIFHLVYLHKPKPNEVVELGEIAANDVFVALLLHRCLPFLLMLRLNPVFCFHFDTQTVVASARVQEQQVGHARHNALFGHYNRRYAVSLAPIRHGKKEWSQVFVLQPEPLHTLLLDMAF
jgi:hypothetical protein